MITEDAKKSRDFWKGCFVGCLVTLVVIVLLVISTRFTGSSDDEERMEEYLIRLQEISEQDRRLDRASYEEFFEELIEDLSAVPPSQDALMIACLLQANETEALSAECSDLVGKLISEAGDES